MADAAVNWDPKDPDEIVDYGLEWIDKLIPRNSLGTVLGPPDVIVSSIWLIATQTGSVEQYGPAEFTDDTTTIWLRGGTAGQTDKITNRVETQGGRTYDWTRSLKIKTK